MLTAQDLVNFAYYRAIPEMNREDDKTVNLALYRYLQVLILGGYSLSLIDIENLLMLVDPEKCPEEFFPLLYECFGLDYYPDVATAYHRKILMNFGELRKRRGTYSCIRFLVKTLTNLDVELEYLRGNYKGEDGRFLIVTLLAKTIDDVINLENDSALVEKFLGLFVPYYITTVIESKIAEQEMIAQTRRANAITYFSCYDIRPKT